MNLLFILLWRVQPGLSAGRVQSVGMALIVERERQRLIFEPTQYSSLKGIFDKNVTAVLQAVNGTIVASSGQDFASQGQQLRPESQHKLHLQPDSCQQLVSALQSFEDMEWRVVSVQSSKRVQQPPQPFRTSTLQQEGVRRLGMSVQQTMRTAQQLYEQGLISYMRTDSTHLSGEAEAAVAQNVTTRFGDHMLVGPGESSKRKMSRKKSKFAQEAHEAIRPAIQGNGAFNEPDLLSASGLSKQAKSLYGLIYGRTLAARMPPMVTNRTKVIIEGSDGTTAVQFQATGSVVIAPGYTVAYGANAHDEDGPSLPPLYEGQSLQLVKFLPQNHETKPPPRYTEASFVKELEVLGVGRPSTYAGIVQTLRDRAYIGSPTTKPRAPRRNGKAVVGAAISAVRAAGGEEFTGGAAQGPLAPSLTAFVVCSLLEKHCPTYVDPDFTSRMEERLDLIASGDGEELGDDQRIAYLNEFYAGETGLAAQIKRIDDEVPTTETRRAVLPALKSSSDKEGNDSGEEIGLFVGPWGPYVQLLSAESETDKPPTASLPYSMASDISKISPATLKTILTTKQGGGDFIGYHPDDGRSIRLKTGRFGAYLQWGDDNNERTTTHSLPREKAVMQDMNFPDGASMTNMLGLTLEQAIGYVGLPRHVCDLDELPITAAIGRYGPYLKYNNTFVSLNPNDGDVLTVDAETAMRLVKESFASGRSKGSRGAVAELGEKDGSMVYVKDGRFGMYINWKRVNAKLPSKYLEKPSELPLEEAWGLIQEKTTAAPRQKSKKKPERNLPKRPLSAYMYFCATKRPEVSEKVKTLGEISKELARLWSETEDRSEYEDLAAKDKARYELEKGALANQNGISNEGSQMTKTRSRAPSAYMLFCKQMRPTLVDENGEKLPFGDAAKRLGNLWKESDDETRRKFQDLAKGEKKIVHAASS